MTFVPRRVRQLKPTSVGELETEAVALASLRTVPAWVLLGEPGSGKSRAFNIEAQAGNGLLLTIANFVYSDIEDVWKNRCLFLDGLDEVRASGTRESILYQVRTKLRKLGSPNFRIACRAADWHGQSDQEEIIGASLDGQLKIYALEPLNLADIKHILQNEFGRTDAEEFIAQADSHGVGALLSNPQTLTLTVKALNGTTWPTSRDETYRLACETLVQEENHKHRDKTRFQPVPREALLDTAGQLFAALLLSDKSGIALDPSVQSERFPALEAFQLNAPVLASTALDTKLFVPSTSNEERLEPTHRSVAEYLAAQWLGKQIDKQGMPRQRVLNLMLGFDGKAVAGLRGLYGWLALTSRKARQWLIKNDPLTVALYSDPRPMDRVDKQQLLHAIYFQAQDNPSTLWRLSEAETLKPLFQADLRDEYLKALENPKRDDATQTYVVFILKVLKHSASEIHLSTELRNTAADASRWEHVRRYALEAWLRSGISSTEVIEFLEQVSQGKISDPDEELTGILLTELFPKVLTASDVLRYLHIPKSKMWEKYLYFWYEFRNTVHENDLPFVLDQLAQRSDLQSLNWMEFHISRTLAALVIRGIQIHGDKISNEKLFTWLHIGTDEYGERRHEPEFHETITQWLIERPERYKGLLKVCFDRNEDAPSPRHGLFNDSQVLRGIPAPSDIGLWHFQQIDSTKNEMLAKEHLAEAVRALWSDQEGLTIDMLVDWADHDAVRKSWLEPHLAWDISERRIAQNDLIHERQYEQANLKRNLSSKLAAKIPAILNGTAPAALMHELAGVWLNRYSNTRGETPLDRFKSYCDNYVEVFNAVKTGMPACIKRDDLPSIKEIIDLHLQQQAHWIRSACLLGMELLWDDNPTAVDLLDSSSLEKMVCFRLTDGTETPPEWFLHLVKNRPELVSKILVAYAGASFKAQKDHVDSIYPLSRDAAYTQLACLSVPALLRSFPTRNKATRLNQLSSLLWAGLKYEMPELASIVAKKLKLKSLDPSQRVYFLLTGTLIHAGPYEQQLWDFVGQSWQRIQHISDFLGNRLSEHHLDRSLGAHTFGKLIEIQAPFAELDWPSRGGVVSQAVNLGDHVRSLIGKLTAQGTSESLQEINRLLGLPSLAKIKSHLLNSKHEAIQKLRENSFHHFNLLDVANILNNSSPTGPQDLQTIVLDCLDQMAQDIKTNNGDLFRKFWTEGADNKHKTENSCRDALLEMLRTHLTPRGIDCQPEVDSANDKRADIRVAYENRFVVPIEIKGEWHPALWTSIQSQLIPQYTKQRETDGFGIYLVLWVGGSEQPGARDGGKKPSIPKELESRLRRGLPQNVRSHIAVRVIDITPAS